MVVSLPDVGAGNSSQILWEINIHFILWDLRTGLIFVLIKFQLFMFEPFIIGPNPPESRF